MMTSDILDVRTAVKAPFHTLEPSELLLLPASALIGVTEAAAAALATLGIRTVFDLGASWTFATARNVCSSARIGGSAFRAGRLPGDVVFDGAGLPLDALADTPLARLRRLAIPDAAALSKALGVDTLRELASWPPFLVARRLVGAESCGTAADPDATPELTPRFNEHPTDRLYYSALVLLEVDDDDLGEGLRQPLSRAVDLAALAPTSEALRPAIGARVTYAQSWYAQGTTLGAMLHSLALAPGENTRIAVVDWSRSTAARVVDEVLETESLAQSTRRDRAMNEVGAAVAADTQQGGSASRATSAAESAAVTASASGGFGVVSGSASMAYQTASSNSTADHDAWTSGTRELGAEVAQFVADRTEQHATAVRNRRASVVREVSQQEHEALSTRVVANYNHMHALTIQYHEVVQVYRVATELHAHERCLFIPFEPIDVTSRAIRERHRRALAAAALTSEVADLLELHDGVVLVRAIASTDRRSILPATPRSDASTAPPAAKAPGARTKAPGTGRLPAPDATSPVHADSPVIDLAVDRRLPAGAALEAVGVVRDKPGLGSSIFNLEIHHVGGKVEKLKPVVDEIDFAFIASRPAVKDVAGIAVNANFHGSVVLKLSHAGAWVTAKVRIDTDHDRGLVVLFEDITRTRERTLVSHLQEHAAHYTRALYRSLDAAALSGYLARYSWKGRPLLEQIDPRPIAVSGNYLVFRAGGDSGEDEDYGALAERHGLLNVDPVQRIVPLPSGGVFAEAVLGRSNSAETLDLTRFWNWQDSPIPLTAPEIATLAAGTRRRGDVLEVASLGAPAVTAAAPTAIPAPTPTSAILSALATPNLFRDLGGLAETQRLAQAALQTATSQAASAGALSLQAMLGEQQKQVALRQLEAEVRGKEENQKLAMARLAAAQSDHNVDATITADGARLAHARKMDAASGSAPDRALASTALLRSTFGAGATIGADGSGPVAATPVAGDAPDGLLSATAGANGGESLGFFEPPMTPLIPPVVVRSDRLPSVYYRRFTDAVSIPVFGQAPLVLANLDEELAYQNNGAAYRTRITGADTELSYSLAERLAKQNAPDRDWITSVILGAVEPRTRTVYRNDAQALGWRIFQQTHIGKGTPETLIAMLALVHHFRADPRLQVHFTHTPADPVASLRSWIKNNVGLDCNGLVGGWARWCGYERNPQVPQTHYRASTRCRTVTQLRAGALIVLDPHIAMIDEVLAIDEVKRTAMVRVVESVGENGLSGLCITRSMLTEAKDGRFDWVRTEVVRPDRNRQEAAKRTMIGYAHAAIDVVLPSSGASGFDQFGVKLA